MCQCQRHDTFKSGLTAGGGELPPRSCRYSRLFYQKSWLTTNGKSLWRPWTVTIKSIKSLFNYVTLAQCKHVKKRGISKSRTLEVVSNNCICVWTQMQDVCLMRAPYMQHWIRSSKPISMLQLFFFTREKSDKQPELGLKPKQGIQVNNP